MKEVDRNHRYGVRNYTLAIGLVIALVISIAALSLVAISNLSLSDRLMITWYNTHTLILLLLHPTGPNTHMESRHYGRVSRWTEEFNFTRIKLRNTKLL